MTTTTLPASSSYRPHSVSRVESTVTRNRRRRAVRIVRNRAALRLVPAMLRGNHSLINLSILLQNRVEVRER